MSSIDIFTDGSYIKKGNKIYCGYGIYFPNNEYKSVGRKFTHEPITNNRAELYAIYKSLIFANIINKTKQISQVNIYSDSEYSVKTFNVWYPNWIKNKKPYLNKDIIDDVVEIINNSNFKVNLIHIRSHTGKKDYFSLANDKADELAKKGAFK